MTRLRYWAAQWLGVYPDSASARAARPIRAGIARSSSASVSAAPRSLGSAWTMACVEGAHRPCAHAAGLTRLPGTAARSRRLRQTEGMGDLEGAGASSRRLPRRPESVAEARRFVRAAVDGVAPVLVDTVELLVSELVTNALLHARTDIDVSARVEDGTVHVRVRDQRPDRKLLPQECPAYIGTGRGTRRRQPTGVPVRCRGGRGEQDRVVRTGTRRNAVAGGWLGARRAARLR
ncbi:ATP-binding protein [Streptomyces thinghirensis]|nr:ATP-binding protein [Streptomyces thinghirensis]